MTPKYFVDPDIRKAHTLPASFYRDRDLFDALRDKVFQRSWQVLEPSSLPIGKERVVPFRLLDGYLPAPLLVSKGQGKIFHCLSNVCTHRGNLLVSERSSARKLVCNYHGRRFSPDGSFEFMPEFEKTLDFPSPCDHLPQFPLLPWGPLWFSSLEPAFDLSGVIGEMEKRIGFLKLDTFKLHGQRTKTYELSAHWALYCDNYLEGFHIPFVHKELDAVLDYGRYDTSLFDHGCLQIGYADESTEAVFNLPEGHMDYGKRVAAYYFWMFPNLMFNFYPWGLSLNVVVPVNPQHTRVKFFTYVCNPDLLEAGAGSGLDKVEMEDEAVVEAVQQGILSPFYSSGRFSPTREKGVHLFHRILAEFMNSET